MTEETTKTDEQKTFTQADLDAEVAGLKTALEAERKSAKEAAAYKKIGLKPDEIQAFLDEKAAAEEKRLEEAGDFKKILEQHKAQWSEEKTALEDRASIADKALKSYVGESALISELAKSGATEEGLRLLPREYLNRIDVKMNGGKPSLSILAPDGETLMAGTSDNGTATLQNLVAEAVKQYPSLFKSDVVGGGGKQPNGGAGSSGKVVTRQAFEAMSQAQRASHIKTGGSVVNP